MRGSERGLETRLLHGLIGASPAFLSAIALVHRFARSKAPILITGETGTGKEFAAHAAHYLSDRSDAAFIPINCGALPDTLIESELFGHVRGAFTDASRARPGLVREPVLQLAPALLEAGFDIVPGGLGGVLRLVELLVQLGRLLAQRLQPGSVLRKS